MLEGTPIAEMRVSGNSFRKLASRRLNRAVAELAASQHGAVKRSQLNAVGLEDWQIEYRLSTSRLHPLHRGVYAVPRRACDQRGIKTHAHCLDARDVTTLDGIPVTSAMRTLVDIAPTVDVQGLARALRRADEQELLDTRPLDRLLGTSPRGARTLRSLLRDYADGPRQKSELERLLRKVCKAHDLPLPHCNVLLHGYELDFLWPDHRLIAEADSWLFHGTRYAFNRDRRRDATLATLHYRTVRFTDLQLVHEPRWVAETLEKLLSAR